MILHLTGVRAALIIYSKQFSLFFSLVGSWLFYLYTIMLVFRLVGVVGEVMGGTFPELKQHEERIKTIIAEEEASFGRTLVKVIKVQLSFFCD